MAEDTVDQAAALAGLEETPTATRKLPIHGYPRNTETSGDLAVYGSDAPLVEELIRKERSFGDKLHPRLPARVGEVVWAVRREMARTVEDVLARRTRCLLLDARASIEVAPLVARLMAKELGKDDGWQERQIRAYQELAEGYMI
jgi:glycerol-3-phosphate dehydrogenase